MTLEEAIRDAAVALTAGHVNRLADAFERFDWPSQGAELEITKSPVRAVRDMARRTYSAWEAAPGVPGAAVALALRTSATGVDAVRRQSSVEVTWSGPPAGVPVRLTSQVILDIVRDAERELIFMSYSASEIDELVEEIDGACTRGVDVKMVFETKEGSGGSFIADAAEAYAALKGKVTFFGWHRDQSEKSGRMHAKAVIGDGRIALVSSANLSRAAMGKNMELGLLIRGGPVPDWLRDHVQALISEGILVRSEGSQLR